MLTPEDVKELRQPFPASWHEFIRGYTYVQEWAICDRLDNVDPSWAFNITNIDRRDEIVTVTATMTVNGVTRENTGSQTIQYATEGDRNSKKWKRDEDGNKIEIGEPEKGATTDALKRCARLFGIGRYLLTLPDSVKDERGLDQWLQAKLARQQPDTEPPGDIDTETGEITAPHVNGTTPIPQVNGQITVTHCKYVNRKDGSGGMMLYEDGDTVVLDFSRDRLRQLGDKWPVIVDQWQSVDREKAKPIKLIAPLVVTYENVYSKEPPFDLAYRKAITLSAVEPELAKASGE